MGLRCLEWSILVYDSKIVRVDSNLFRSQFGIRTLFSILK